jgi:hypothetical protein
MTVESGQSVPKSKVDASHFVPKSKVAGSWDPNALTWVEHQFYLTSPAWSVSLTFGVLLLQNYNTLFIWFCGIVQGYQSVLGASSRGREGLRGNTELLAHTHSRSTQNLQSKRSLLHV